MGLNSKQYGSLMLRKEFESPITELTAGAASIEVEVDANYRQWYMAVEFYSDADGTTSVPTSGTMTFTVTTAALRTVEQVPTGNVVDLSVANTEVNASGNIQTVKAVMDSIAGGSTTHCRVRVIGNVT